MGDVAPFMGRVGLPKFVTEAHFQLRMVLLLHCTAPHRTLQHIITRCSDQTSSCMLRSGKILVRVLHTRTFRLDMYTVLPQTICYTKAPSKRQLVMG